MPNGIVVSITLLFVLPLLLQSELGSGDVRHGLYTPRSSAQQAVVTIVSGPAAAAQADMERLSNSGIKIINNPSFGRHE